MNKMTTNQYKLTTDTGHEIICQDVPWTDTEHAMANRGEMTQHVMNEILVRVVDHDDTPTSRMAASICRAVIEDFAGKK